MPKVIIERPEDLDFQLKKFKRQCEQAGIFDACKKHEFFIKKNIRRKEKSKRAMILRNKLAKKSKRK